MPLIRQVKGENITGPCPKSGIRLYKVRADTGNYQLSLALPSLSGNGCPFSFLPIYYIGEKSLQIKPFYKFVEFQRKYLSITHFPIMGFVLFT